MQVEDNLAQAEKQAEDHRISDRHINDPWNDAMIDLYYIWEYDFTPNISHDLEILQSHWNNKDGSASVPRVYTDGKREW